MTKQNNNNSFRELTIPRAATPVAPLFSHRMGVLIEKIGGNTMYKFVKWLKSLFSRIKIKSYIVKYDTPVHGNVYKKGCFKNINKRQLIKYNHKKVGKGKIRNDKTGIFIEGYITEEGIKDEIKEIKNFELTGISIGCMETGSDENV